MDRLGSLARGFALEILIVILAIESAVEVTLRHHAQRHPYPGWFTAPAIALVIIPLLGYRRFPFWAPATLWLLAAAVSFADGRLVVTPVSAFLAGMIASYLLGNLAEPGISRGARSHIWRTSHPGTGRVQLQFVIMRLVSLLRHQSQDHDR
jgi:hypothetical protein